MAVTSVVEHRNGSTGSHSWAAGPSYRASWVLKTDSEQDQAQTVLTYFRANVVELGSLYTYAGDAGATSARAQTISADKIGEDCKTWLITVDYSPESAANAQQETETPGVYSDDPLDWAPTLEVQTVQYQRPVISATYRGGLDATDFDGEYPIGTSGLYPMNSAQSPYRNPVVSQDASRIAVLLGRNWARWTSVNDVKQYENYVNTDQFWIGHRGQILHFPAGTAKIREATIEPRTWKGSQYLKIEWMIDQAPALSYWNHEGTPGLVETRDWREYLIDEGTEVIAEAGDVVAGRPRLVVPLDKDKNPIAGPFLLNGAGQAAASGARARVGIWEHYQSTAYLAIPLLGSLLSATPPVPP